MRGRRIVTSFLTGVLLVGAGWAGVGVSPVDRLAEKASEQAGTALTSGAPKTAAAIGEGVILGADEALVGAAKVSIEPQPDASKGQVWEHNRAKCLVVQSGNVNDTLTHAADPRTPWIENTNCIYAGGFGIGPSQPLTSYDQEYGLWSRSVAFSRGGQTLVLTILDGEGYFGAYNRLCGANPCGIFDLQKQLAAELGLPPDSFVFASTHAHSAPDFIGGWGAVPQWYMDQVAEAMRQSVRDAIASMQPATIEAGETIARGNNSERRDTYRSAEDPTVNWVRAVDRLGNVIATAGTFAAHATSFGGSAQVAHADWPGVFDKTVETRFGGVGLMFEAGLGNMSTRGGAMMGRTLGNLIPPVGSGTLVTAPDVRVKQEFWDQPVTNLPLGSLGAAGFFDRPFSLVSAQITANKPDSRKPCVSASPVSVHVSATAAKIGSVVVTAAPGEIFANFSNTIEELSPITALAIGQANDALGYMPQSFETDHPARQGLGFAGAKFFEYEDAYSIDACFGDRTLETQFRLLSTL